MNKNFGYMFKKCTKNKMTSLTVVYRRGSFYEKPGEYGISHLMEHLLCKTFIEFENQFTNDCIDFDAYTSMDYTVFSFKGLESKLTPELKQTLVKRITGGIDKYVTSEQFENEKKIVLQELFGAYENPSDGHMSNIMYGYFGLVEPAGIPTDIENITYKQVKDLAKTVYKTPSRIVETGSKSTTFKVNYTEEVPTVSKIKFKKTKNIIATVSESERANIFGFSKKPLKKSDFPYVRIGMMALFDGLLSPFYQELREKRGLCYFLSGDTMTMDNTGLVITYIDTAKDQINETLDIFNKMRLNIKKYLTKERFNIIINMLKTAKEIKENSAYKDLNKLIYADTLQMPKNLDKIDYNKTVGLVEKYLYNLEIIVK